MVDLVVPGHIGQKCGCGNAAGPRHARFGVISGCIIFKPVVNECIGNGFDEVIESEELLGIFDRVWFADFIQSSES